MTGYNKGMEEIDAFGPPLKPGSLDHIGGRKPLPEHKKRKRRVLYLTDAEWSALLPFIASVRQGGMSNGA